MLPVYPTRHSATRYNGRITGGRGHVITRSVAVDQTDHTEKAFSSVYTPLLRCSVPTATEKYSISNFYSVNLTCQVTDEPRMVVSASFFHLVRAANGFG